MVNLEMCGGGVEVSGALRTRMDVATEFVVIGDLIGSSEAQEDGILGEADAVARAAAFPTVKFRGRLAAHSHPPRQRIRTSLDV